VGGSGVVRCMGRRGVVRWVEGGKMAINYEPQHTIAPTSSHGEQC